MAGEPQLAASDLAIKLDFQKKQLDRKLVDLGYEAIMFVFFEKKKVPLAFSDALLVRRSTATDSARALLESLPNRASMGKTAAALELESIRANVFFACFEKCVVHFYFLLALVCVALANPLSQARTAAPEPSGRVEKGRPRQRRSL